jgi:hypothetical protein
MIGLIIGVIITGGVGVLLVILGFLLWKREMITLLHNYHVSNVSPENRRAFCKLSGIGLIVIGLSLLITAGILGITDSAYSFICFGVGFAVGLFALIAAGMMYNQ